MSVVNPSGVGPTGPSVTVRRGADGVATLLLDRPAVLNALDAGLLDGLHSALRELAADRKVRALVMTGSGRAFSSGMDLSGLPSDPVAQRAAVEHVMRDRFAPIGELLAAFPAPTLAAVNGLCAGGGVALALLADVVVARRSAYFLVPQVATLGIVPDVAATWLLPRIVGRARSLGLGLLGERLSAQDAARWGLIWECVDDDAFDGTVLELAARLAGLRPEAVRATRALMDASLRGLSEQLDAETQAQLALVPSPVAQVRMDEFAERARTRAAGT